MEQLMQEELVEGIKNILEDNLLKQASKIMHLFIRGRIKYYVLKVIV